MVILLKGPILMILVNGLLYCKLHVCFLLLLFYTILKKKYFILEIRSKRDASSNGTCELIQNNLEK